MRFSFSVGREVRALGGSGLFLLYRTAPGIVRQGTLLTHRFDVRAFHDQVLGNGALPLGVLEANIRSWVGERKAAIAKK